MDPSAIKGPGSTAAARGVDRANARRPARPVLMPSQAVSALLSAEATGHEPHGSSEASEPSPPPLPDLTACALLEAREREQDGGHEQDLSALLRVRAYTRQALATDAEPDPETDVAI